MRIAFFQISFMRSVKWRAWSDVFKQDSDRDSLCVDLSSFHCTPSYPSKDRFYGHENLYANFPFCHLPAKQFSSCCLFYSLDTIQFNLLSDKKTDRRILFFPPRIVNGSFYLTNFVKDIRRFGIIESFFFCFVVCCSELNCAFVCWRWVEEEKSTR